MEKGRSSTEQRELFGKADKESRLDLRAELDKLEAQIEELRLFFEQYFTGLIGLPPDKLHGDVRRNLRTLTNAPFKNSALNFRLRSIKGRYQAYHTYWQRVLKEREEGTYSKDVFKASVREKFSSEDKRSTTTQGAAEKGFKELFNTYRNELERQSGKTLNIDYEAFKKSLVERAKDFKEKNGAKKLSFQVVVKEGRVTIQAKAKS